MCHVCGPHCVAFGVFVVSAVNLVYALKAYLHVLQRVEKSHQLVYGTVELAYYILHREHHTERKLPVDHRRCRHHRYYYVLQLVYEYASRLLCLLQLQALHLHAEEVGLCVLPFPAAPLPAVLQLYFLH